MAPCRRTSQSSMESAPASIPATTPEAFSAAFGDGTLRCSASRVVQASPSGQEHQRDQTRHADQVGVIETGVDGVECLDLSDAPSEPVN